MKLGGFSRGGGDGMPWGLVFVIGACEFLLEGEGRGADICVGLRSEFYVWTRQERGRTATESLLGRFWLEPRTFNLYD